MLLVWDCKNVTGKLGHLVPYIDGVSGLIMTLLSWPAQIRIWECGLLLVFNRCCKEWLERSETWRLPSMSSRVVMNLILMSPTMIVRFNLRLKQMRIFSQPNQLHRGRGNVITAMKFHRNGKYFNVGTQFAHCVLSYWTAEEDPLTANVMSAVSPFRMSFLFSQVSWNSKSEQEPSEWQDETAWYLTTWYNLTYW